MWRINRSNIAVLAGSAALLFAATFTLCGPAASRPFAEMGFYAAALSAAYLLVFHILPGMRSESIIFSSTAIIISGVALRLIMFSYPLSDDVNRYAWEGWIQNRALNPYINPPEKLANEFSGDEIYAGINHKGFSAIYPPGALLAFRVISGTSYSLRAYKLFFIAVDILNLILIALLLKRLKIPGARLSLYAWNPLVLLCGAGEGHIDIFHISFIAAALLCQAVSLKKNAWIWPAGMFFMLGCAIMVKYLSVIFLPFLIKRENRKFLVFFIFPFLAFLPFFDPGIFSGLMKFSAAMYYNDVIPRILRLFLGGGLYSIAMLVIFGIGAAAIWLLCQDGAPERGMIFVYVWCLLCLPLVHIWYLLPLTLLAPIRPYRPAFVLMLTAASGFYTLNYQLTHNIWKEFAWVWLLTYLPFFIVIFRDWINPAPPWFKTYPLPESIDIVIPVYNEADHIDGFAAALLKSVSYLKAELGAGCPEIRIIVADGGSRDATRELLKKYAAIKTISAPGGRGNQIAAAIASGKGALALMLHADAIVSETALLQLMEKLSGKPKACWGIMRHGYDRKSFRMGIVRLANILRFKCLAMAFGDQGIFVRRETLEEVGGFPRIPLMEDVEISLRLNRFPRVALKETLTVSARRWQSQSFGAYFYQVFTYVLWYLLARRLGGNIDRLAARMHHKYYA